MRTFTGSGYLFGLIALAICIPGCRKKSDDDESSALSIESTSPVDGATDVAINKKITAIFSASMDQTTISQTTFRVTGPGNQAIAGSVNFFDTANTAVFTPEHKFAANTLFTATVTVGAKDADGGGLASDSVWTFTTGTSIDTTQPDPSFPDVPPIAAGPNPVTLGKAGDFVILAKAGISTTGSTTVVGDIGLSPAAQTYITGFSEALDATNVFATAAIVTGKLYASDMDGPTPANLTAAVSDMEAAYTDAAGRTLPDHTELGAGDISGMTLEPGLYKWGTGVLLTSDVTLAGGAKDVWIFQIAKDLTVNSGVAVTLSGGALSKNIFWQVAGQATIGTTSAMKGVMLSQTQIALNTGATLDGRALAQTAVTLDANAVMQPAP